MRPLFAILMLAACGDDGAPSPPTLLDAPNDCTAGQLTYVHDLDGAMMSGMTAGVSHAFGNAIGDPPKGQLFLFPNNMAMSPIVTIEFSRGVVNGGSVAAHGSVALPDVTIADCQPDGVSGRLFKGTSADDYYKFQLPVCDDAGVVVASFAGCYRSPPF